jgi:membrane fusion protein (multidrug efflux system)
MPTQRRFKIILIAICVFIFGVILFNIIKQGVMGYFLAHYEPPPVAVSSVTATARDWQPYLSSVGNFVALNGVDVNAQTSGNVVAVHFESGQHVQANSPLIDIDDSIEQASLKFSQAEFTLKEINYKRMQELFTKRATSNSSLDEAKASLEQAKANVDKIQAQIRQKHIVSPFAGKLGIRQVNLGQYITPGQTKIVTLQSVDPLYLHFYIPEQDYKKLRKNQRVLINLEDYPTLQFVSKITAINPIADTNTHNIEVQATLPNCPQEALMHFDKYPWIKLEKDPHSSLTLVTCDTEGNQAHDTHHYAFLPGMFASIDIVLPKLPNAIVLPATAISYSLYGDAVYLIAPLSKTQAQKQDKTTVYQVKRVFVKTGDKNGNDIVITSGVKPGDVVVSAGELKLQNDTRVVINNDIALNQNPNIQNLNQ